ncbi:MAG: M20/M25/M40 family metallo-hydrolase [Clostridia bacterium]|nr:M20/M25/M40 family metallo-hydrolase [Clostridia bacterium]
MTIKKLLSIGIPAAVGVPAAALAAKAVAVKKELPDREPAVNWTPEEEAEYAEKLSAMIRIPTVSKKEDEPYDDFTVFQEKLAELFPKVFSTLENHDVNGNLLRRWKGTDPAKNGVLFMGHQDVVPVDQAGWTKDPFSGEIEDGCIWGRGAMDCKSTVFCELQAFEELLEEGFVPEQDIWFFASRNEENSGGGSEAAAEYLLQRGVRLDLVMDEGGAVVSGMLPGLKAPTAAIGVVEKGFCNVKFTAKSAGGHSSTPPKNSPLIRLSKLMVEVDRRMPFKAALVTPMPEIFDNVAPYMSFPLRFLLANHKVFGGLIKQVFVMLSGQTRAFVQSTAAFTMAEGSTAANVLPDEASVICNIRPSIQQNAEKTVAVLKKIADKYDVETEVLFSRDASNTSSPESGEFRYLRKCLNECLPDCVATPYLMTGGTDSRRFETVCDNVLRFTPTRLTKEQLAAMHAANENVSVSAIAEGVKVYKYLIKHR